MKARQRAVPAQRRWLIALPKIGSSVRVTCGSSFTTIPFLIEYGGGHDDHGAVDCPAGSHAGQRVQKLIFELFFDDVVTLCVPLAALDDFGMQEDVVRHDDRTQVRP